MTGGALKYGPPQRAHQQEATQRDGDERAGDAAIGERLLDRGRRGEDAFAQNDDREQPVALGDVLRMPGCMPSERSAQTGIASSMAPNANSNTIPAGPPSITSRTIHRIWTSPIPAAKCSATGRPSGSSRPLEATARRARDASAHSR